MKKFLILLALFIFLFNMSFGCAGIENKVLIVMDNDAISNWGDLTSVSYYEDILNNMSFGNNMTYNITIWNEDTSGNPSLSYLQSFGVVIWTAGDYTAVMPGSSDIVTLENYVEQGGNLIISGAWLINDYGQNSYTDNVLHANSPTKIVTLLEDINITNITHVVTSGFVQNELFNLIVSPTGRSDYEPDVIENVVNGGQILSVRGSASVNTGSPTIVAFENETIAARVVYFAFPIFLLNETNRTNLIENSMNWMDNYAPIINNVSSTPGDEDGIDPDVQLNFTSNVTDLHSVSVVKFEYKCAAGAGICSPGTDVFSEIIMDYNNITQLYENASFTPDVPGIWQYRIWANDTLGNGGYGETYNISVQYDYSWTRTPSIFDSVSCLFSSVCTLGDIIINNTGDFNLSFDLFSNYEDTIYNVTEPFNLTAKQFKVIRVNATAGGVTAESNIIITINSTSTNANPSESSVNVTFISFGGGAYLSNTLVDYVTEVNQGESIDLHGSVKNIGNGTAFNTTLTWVVPSSSWVNVSGNLTQDIGNLTVSATQDNNVSINVLSSVSPGVYNIFLNSTCSNNVSGCSDSESFLISVSCSNTDGICGSGCTYLTDSDCEQEVINIGGGSGGGGSKSGEIIYSKEIKILRAEADSFDVEIYNKYINSTLEDLTLTLIGFPEQYIMISPSKIDVINYKETQNFSVVLNIPSYKKYGEYSLKAVIEGYLITRTSKKAYKETQNIKLIIQEVDEGESNLSLTEAENAIKEMKDAGFNINEVSSLLTQSKFRFSENKNKESQTLSEKIIKIKNRAFETDDLIRRILVALKNPREMDMITGNVVKETVKENDELSSVNFILTGRIIFGSESIKETLQMAIAAFERGDYDTAQERAKSAQALLLLERKGNFGLFLYLYWHFIILVLVMTSITWILSYRKYQQFFITKKIDNINRKERNIRKLLQDSQKKYFAKQISSMEYRNMVDQHQNKLVKLKKTRLNLRNKRIKMLARRQVFQDLGMEKIQIESEIKILQKGFYKDRKISESDYKKYFHILNERLVEIEGERMTLDLLKEKKFGKINIRDVGQSSESVIVKKQGKGIRDFMIKGLWELSKKEKNIKEAVGGLKNKLSLGFNKDRKTTRKKWFLFRKLSKLFKKLSMKNEDKEIILMDSKIMDMLKRETSKMDCRGKWIELKVKEGEKKK